MREGHTIQADLVISTLYHALIPLALANLLADRRAWIAGPTVLLVLLMFAVWSTGAVTPETLMLSTVQLAFVSALSLIAPNSFDAVYRTSLPRVFAGSTVCMIYLAIGAALGGKPTFTDVGVSGLLAIVVTAARWFVWSPVVLWPVWLILLIGGFACVAGIQDSLPSNWLGYEFMLAFECLAILYFGFPINSIMRHLQGNDGMR